MTFALTVNESVSSKMKKIHNNNVSTYITLRQIQACQLHVLLYYT